eukprot:4710486-Prymnesium_polylepis.1
MGLRGACTHRRQAQRGKSYSFDPALREPRIKRFVEAAPPQRVKRSAYPSGPGGEIPPPLTCCAVH